MQTDEVLMLREEQLESYESDPSRMLFAEQCEEVEDVTEKHRGNARKVGGLGFR